MAAKRDDFKDVKWIVFDAVGTLIYAHPPVAQVYCKAAREAGLDLEETVVRARFREAYRGAENENVGGMFLWDDPAALRTSEDEEHARWRTIVEEVLGDLISANGRFDDLFDYFGRPEAWAAYPDVADTLRACRAGGYRLAMASNFDRRLETVHGGMPELAPIGTSVISSIVGYRKPSRHFYNAVVAATSSRASEILMVGDDQTNDIEGAQNAGLPALRVDRSGTPASGAMASLTELKSILSIE